MRPLFALSLLCLTGCVTGGLRQSAAAALDCPVSSVTIGTNVAGAVLANGCGQWIEYACVRYGRGVSCSEGEHGYLGVSAGPRRRTSSAGYEDRACFGNQTCFAPLVCVQQLCVRPSGPGRFAGPCVAGQCGASLACVNGRCEPGAAVPPPEVGERSGPCYPNATCNAGLRCLDTECVDSSR